MTDRRSFLAAVVAALLPGSWYRQRQGFHAPYLEMVAEESWGMSAGMASRIVDIDFERGEITVEPLPLAHEGDFVFVADERVRSDGGCYDETEKTEAPEVLTVPLEVPWPRRAD